MRSYVHFQMSDMDAVESQCSDFAANMLTDEDYLNFMSDTLFSTITNHQPFAFPDCREIGIHISFQTEKNLDLYVVSCNIVFNFSQRCKFS